jgi:hypothetical protein
MERQGVCTDNDEVDVMGVQEREELVEVWRQIHGLASAGIRRPQDALPAVG